MIASNLPVVSGVTSNNSPLSSVSICYSWFIAVKNHSCTGISFYRELTLIYLFSLISDNGMTNVAVLPVFYCPLQPSEKIPVND